MARKLKKGKIMTTYECKHEIVKGGGRQCIFCGEVPMADPLPDINKAKALVTELTLQLKEKQGTERKEVQALIDKTIDQLLLEAKIEELERLAFTIDNTRKDMDEPQDTTSKVAIKIRLLQLQALKQG